MEDDPKLPDGYESWYHDSIGGWIFSRKATQPGVRITDPDFIHANGRHGEDGYQNAPRSPF